jgi:pyruvate kinase
MQLSFGVVPLITRLSSDPEKTVVTGMAQITKAGLLRKGNKFVLVTDAKAHEMSVSTIQVRSVS